MDYIHETENPITTIRNYEWRGVLQRIGSLVALHPGTSWLDYGCGTGGLVRFLRENGFSEVCGTEQGFSLERLRGSDVPVLDIADLDKARGSFDVITAIEVIEHTVDPISELRRMRALLRPGGLLFLTTGNARPHAHNLLKWSYLQPEIHISLFEPDTIARALRRTGFESVFPGYGPGWTNIIRFKVLKNLRRRAVGGWERLLPWPVLTRALDHRLQLSAHPVGRAV